MNEFSNEMGDDMAELWRVRAVRESWDVQGLVHTSKQCLANFVCGHAKSADTGVILPRWMEVFGQRAFS